MAAKGNKLATSGLSFTKADTLVMSSRDPLTASHAARHSARRTPHVPVCRRGVVDDAVAVLRHVGVAERVVALLHDPVVLLQVLLKGEHTALRVSGEQNARANSHVCFDSYCSQGVSRVASPKCSL